MQPAKQKRYYYNDLITHITPLLMYMAPLKQRAVLEVLVRKTAGITIDMSDRTHFHEGSVDVEVSFDFEVGLQTTMTFVLDVGTFEHLRAMLYNNIVSYTYLRLEDGTGVPVYGNAGEHESSEHVAVIQAYGCKIEGDVLELTYFAPEPVSVAPYMPTYSERFKVDHFLINEID